MDNMKNISSVFKQIQEQSYVGMLTLDVLVGSFLNLQRWYANEYKLYSLLHVHMQFPCSLRNLRVGTPFRTQNMDMNISAWKTLLGEKYSVNSTDMDSPYSQLWHSYILLLKIAVTDTWKAIDSQQILIFLESWENLLPPLVLQKNLDTVAKPEISLAVDSWDPHVCWKKHIKIF